MRIFTSLLIFLFGLASIGQVYKHPESKGYLRITAELFIANDKGQQNFPAGFFGTGHVFQNSISLGVDFGACKTSEFNHATIPIGAQIGISNFKKKKIAPVLFIGVYYPYHKEVFTASFNSGGSLNTLKKDTRGTLQIKGTGGILLPVVKKEKIIISAGYSQINFKTKTTNRYQDCLGDRSVSSTATTKIKTYIVSLGFMMH